MNLNTAMRASSSGLSAERYRMDVISANIANANSVQQPGQEAWRRQDVILMGTENGPKVMGTAPDLTTPMKTVKQPGNPFADADGNVQGSNVEPIMEMVNMMTASRAYEANVAAFNTAKSMMKSALTIGKV